LLITIYFSRITQDIVHDNGVKEGNIFNLLKDFKFCLQTISTSMVEMGPSKGMTDTVITCFTQLSSQFAEIFDKAYSIRAKGKTKGGNVIHPENCDACQLLKVSKFQKQFFLFSFPPKNERHYSLISALRI
jgi:hypothetical protein